MACNIAEWAQDWFGFDYCVYMPERNPPVLVGSRYRIMRAYSQENSPVILRIATHSESGRTNRPPPRGSVVHNNSSWYELLDALADLSQIPFMAHDLRTSHRLLYLGWESETPLNLKA